MESCEGTRGVRGQSEMLGDFSGPTNTRCEIGIDQIWHACLGMM